MNFLNEQPEARRGEQPVMHPVDMQGGDVMNPQQGHEQVRPVRQGRMPFASTQSSLSGFELAFKTVLLQVNSSHNTGGHMC